MTTPATALSPAPSMPDRFTGALGRLYLTRFVFAVVWAALLFTTAKETGPGLTTLVVIYPLFDAGAVLWQIRTAGDPGSRAAEWINVAVSVVVAIALAVASTSSIGTTLMVWGTWAICSGLPQLVAAIRNRRTGGQVPQMLSGGISVLAGASFIAQGADDPASMAGAGGYAILGGVFFLISALRLRSVARGAVHRP
jgi:hypothetical protein